MTDLIPQLQRSPADGDRELAGLLGSFRCATGAHPRPRATVALATFIAEQGAERPNSPHHPSPLGADSDLLVVLGPPPVPRAARRSRSMARVVTAAMGPAGLWGKVAFAAAAAAVVAGVVVSGGPPRDAVVVPADRSTVTGPASPSSPSAEAEPTPRAQPVRPSSDRRRHRADPGPMVGAEGQSAPPTSPLTGKGDGGRDTAPTPDGTQSDDDQSDDSNDSNDGDEGDEGDSGTPDDAEVADDSDVHDEDADDSGSDHKPAEDSSPSAEE